MTKMLASVTSVSEAEKVLAEAADIIDLKDPQAGALGALSTDVVFEIVAVIDKRVTTSATIGDVYPDDLALLEKIQIMAATKVDIVKVGLFATKPSEYFIEVITKACEQGIALVVVLFAEDYTGLESCNALLDTGIKGIMLDTKNKNGKSLCEVLNDSVLREFIEVVTKRKMLTGLAGSLQYQDITKLLRLEPDYLGFRGALCSENNRTNQLDQFKIKKIRNVIPRIGLVDYDKSNKEDEVLKNGTMA